MAIVGLGYVGLPLGLGFVDAGLTVVGYDEDEHRLRLLRSGVSPVDGVSNDGLVRALGRGLTIRAPHEPGMAELDAIFVCVSTPITEAREPDLGAVLAAADMISSHLRRGQIVILQSTTWPGTTRGPFKAALERSGLVAGEDFSLAYAPERVSPGEPGMDQSRLPRLVGGVTQGDTDRAAQLMARLGGEVHRLSSPDAAEMAKLLENVFRNVNIALVNQLAILSEKMDLDVWEVIEAAATKPFGFMPFRPGPGVGGHCIPVDPYYLAWRSRQFGLPDQFVELAGDINAHMPFHVADLVAAALNERVKPINHARVGVIGVAFKPNVRDARNSPAGQVMAELTGRGASLAYHDPHVPTFMDSDGHSYRSVPLEQLLSDSDVAVVLVAHDAVDWELLYRSAELVVDAVNSSRGRDLRPRQVLRLGAGWSNG